MSTARNRARASAPEAPSEPEASPEAEAAPEATPEAEAPPAPKAPEPAKATGLRYRCKHLVGYGNRDYRKGDELPKLNAVDEKRLLKLGAIERILEDGS